MLKKFLHPNFKKISIIQYGILITFSVVLILIAVVSVISFILCLSNNVPDFLDPIEEVMAGLGLTCVFWVVFCLPVGIAVAALSTVAFVLEWENKWILAKVFNLISSILVAKFAMLIMEFEKGVNDTMIVSSILWCIVIFNAYAILFNRPENLRKIKENKQENNEKCNED